MMKNAIAIYAGFAEMQPLTWLFFFHPEKEWQTEEEVTADFARSFKAWAVALYEDDTDPKEAMRDLAHCLHKAELHEFMRFWPENTPPDDFLPAQMDGWQLIDSPKEMAAMLAQDRVVVPQLLEDDEDSFDALFRKM